MLELSRASGGGTLVSFVGGLDHHKSAARATAQPKIRQECIWRRYGRHRRRRGSRCTCSQHESGSCSLSKVYHTAFAMSRRPCQLRRHLVGSCVKTMRAGYSAKRRRVTIMPITNEAGEHAATTSVRHSVVVSTTAATRSSRTPRRGQRSYRASRCCSTCVYLSPFPSCLIRYVPSFRHMPIQLFWGRYLVCIVIRTGARGLKRMRIEFFFSGACNWQSER